MAQSNIPEFLEEAFESNFSSLGADNTQYEFYTVDIGSLKVTNGKIIACDPIVSSDDFPFSANFPTGQFPVQLAVAKIKDDERVGFARIKFSDAIPITWAIATFDEQDIESLPEDDVPGYGVDSGTGAFMDSAGGRALMEYLEGEDNYEIVIEEMEKTYKDTWSWLLWEKDNANVAMFSSGWGDGVYTSYIGYDANNNICRLVTDFQLLFDVE